MTSGGSSDADRLTTLAAIASAFDRHDLEAILEHFADDAVFESPGGGENWGRRFVGKDAVREAFAGRFSSIRMFATRTRRTSWRVTVASRSGRSQARSTANGRSSTA